MITAVNDFGWGPCINQDDAFTAVMNRGGTEIVESGLDRPVVVIGGSFYKDEVSDTVWSENGGETSLGSPMSSLAAAERSLFGEESEIEVWYSIEDSGLDSLELC